MIFSEGPMADERKLNGSPSINKEYIIIIIIPESNGILNPLTAGVAYIRVFIFY